MSKLFTLSRTCLPPVGCGLFLFCCFVGWRADPDWALGYGLLAAFRLVRRLVEAQTTVTVDIFEKWR